MDLRTLPRVDVVVSYQGADGVAIDALVDAGARGIVSAGTGAGYPTPGEVEALERAAAAGVIVVQASRVGAGRVPAVPALLGRGWVAADDLAPPKARILLRLALADGIARPRGAAGAVHGWLMPAGLATVAGQPARPTCGIMEP